MSLLLPAVGLVGIVLFTLLLSRKAPSAPLPPGPKPLPIVGNVNDLPPADKPDWLHWLKHKDLYGPISSVSVFGQRLVVLNEARLAVDLLDKRSAVHSDRPQMPFAKLAGWEGGMGLLEYGKRLQTSRRMLHKEVGTSIAAARFNPTVEVEVRRFLLRTINTPQDLIQHVRKLTGAIILKIGYGYSVAPHGQDPLVDLVDEAMEQLSLAARPGTWLVDFAPILRFIPAWFPGAGFQRTAQIFRRNSEALCSIPYSFVQKQMEKPSFEPSFLSNLLETEPAEPGSPEEIIVKWAAASLYAGGGDTTVSSISSFFLVMALFPEAQKKGQEEIDRVIGSDRLPRFDDRERLPYIDALVKETLRWHPIGPMGVAHQSMEDDICNGYFIPKKSIIVANIWAYCHDPNEYSDPMAYKPERFLGENPEKDPHLLVFGFGRRICPGKVLADSNLFLTVAQTLASCNITKPIRGGKEVDIKPEFRPGLISHPAPFEVSVKPRNKKYGEIIRAVEKEHPWDERDAETLRGMTS